VAIRWACAPYEGVPRALVLGLTGLRHRDVGPAAEVASTIDAIAAFQAKAGLPRTGQIDTGLVAALQGNST